MRRALFLIPALALTSCAYGPPQPYRSADGQQQFLRLTEGKVAQRPISCLPGGSSSDMTVIDQSTLVFRRGPGRSYVVHMRGSCSGLGQPGYALVTRQYGSGMCSGDIATVMQTSIGMTVGSCSVGEIVPFVRPG